MILTLYGLSGESDHLNLSQNQAQWHMLANPQASLDCIQWETALATLMPF